MTATKPQPRPGVLDIAPYVPGKSTAPGVAKVFKLSSNETPLGPGENTIAAYRAAAEHLQDYPDGSASALREAIGQAFGLDPARIVCGAGSDDLLNLIARAFLADGDEAIHTTHGFLVYPIATQGTGAKPIAAPETNFTADVNAILKLVTPRTKVVFLANPNNPTGTYLPFDEVKRLHRALPGNVLLVLDAAYAEYVEHKDYEPGIRLVDAGDNTVMTRTFSKVFGLGGMRIGWAYAPPAVVDVLNRVRGPFNVSIAAQAAAIAALETPGWVERSRTHNTEYRKKLAANLEAAGIRTWPSEGNFVLADFGTPELADTANAFLRGRGMIVRGVAGYGLPACLRITVGTAEEVGLVSEALALFMAERSGAERHG
jgi:histidinol-phosphate aminotransferase